MMNHLAVVHNMGKGTNCVIAQLLADILGCDRLMAVDNPSLDQYETVIFVLSNTGDEELQQPMEDYLCALTTRNKRYLVCELGNYFGLENYCGCKKVAFQILDDLGWTRVSDISVDSLPEFDNEPFKRWVQDIRPLCHAQPSS